MPQPVTSPKPSRPEPPIRATLRGWLSTAKSRTTITMSLRLSHLSDIHITARGPTWAMRDWCTKRLTGWFNLRYMGRANRFRQAEEVLAVLAAELRLARKPDHVIFSGDATALGFVEEMERAAALLGVGDQTVSAALAVPGNHDYYTAGVAASGLFEQFFGPWQTGLRVDEAAYPFAQRARQLLAGRSQFQRR